MKLKVVFVLLLAGLVAAYTTMRARDLPAERQGRAWLDVFNRGDRAALAKFLADSYPTHAQDSDVERYLGFRDQTQGFDLRKVEESATERFTALVQERCSDQFARMTVRVEGAARHAITELTVRAIPRPPDFPVARLSDGDLARALGKTLDQQTENDRFAGAVLLVHRGKTVFRGAYGLADRTTAAPDTVDTRFRVGSMNKMFTATAVLQLVQAGKVGLQDPLGKYLPDYPNEEIARKVTIHQLLTHTGGTGDIFGPHFDEHRLQLRTLQDYVKLYGDRGLAFEPGSKWEYSNYGMLLLGVVIEKASGQSYYDYVHDHIFVPAGMLRTGSVPEDEPVPDRSMGYTKDGAGLWQPNTTTLPYRGTSAGGGYSTVDDLARFASALTGRVLLDERSTELLTTGKVQIPDGPKYAYGFEERVEQGVRSFGHGGGAEGMNGALRIYPDSGYVVVVLSNLDPPAAERVAGFIDNRLQTQK